MAPPKWLAAVAAATTIEEVGVHAEAALTAFGHARAYAPMSVARQPLLLAAAANALQLAAASAMNSSSELGCCGCLLVFANNSITAGAAASAQLQGEACGLQTRTDHAGMPDTVRRRLDGSLRARAHACDNRAPRLTVVLRMPARAGLFEAAATAAPMLAAALSAKTAEAQQQQQQPDQPSRTRCLTQLQMVGDMVIRLAAEAAPAFITAAAQPAQARHAREPAPTDEGPAEAVRPGGRRMAVAAAAANLALAATGLGHALLCSVSFSLCRLRRLPGMAPDAAQEWVTDTFVHMTSLRQVLPSCQLLVAPCTFSAAVPELLRFSQHALALQVAVLYEGAGGLSPIPADAAAGCARSPAATAATRTASGRGSGSSSGSDARLPVPPHHKPLLTAVPWVQQLARLPFARQMVLSSQRGVVPLALPPLDELHKHIQHADSGVVMSLLQLAVEVAMLLPDRAPVTIACAATLHIGLRVLGHTAGCIAGAGVRGDINVLQWPTKVDWTPLQGPQAAALLLPVLHQLSAALFHVPEECKTRVGHTKAGLTRRTLAVFAGVVAAVIQSGACMCTHAGCRSAAATRLLLPPSCSAHADARADTAVLLCLPCPTTRTQSSPSTSQLPSASSP
jgi:hypothetical protein